MEWKPIEGAPTDGTEFVCWFSRDSTHGDWEPKCRFDEHGALQVYGRVDYDQDGWEVYSGDWNPTHFMVIAPPKKTAP